ncbi:MAG TPA: hypothetical protein PLO62_07360 [Candidatus Hydrogenedentes bacterium]|nr:hypothetical protein [Candidatus Hydrogenedentota bacterium]HOS03479.1 hypothetical protein [Candidatus Hydrogenedentota bacterium]
MNARMKTVAVFAVWAMAAWWVLASLAGCGKKDAPPPSQSAADASKTSQTESVKPPAQVVFSGPDGGKMTLHEDGSMTAESSDGTVEMTANSMKISAEKGDFSATIGDAAKLPDNYPKDLPQYSNATLTLASESKEDKTITAQWKTSSPMSEVAAYYEKALQENGWTLAQKMEQTVGQTMIMLHGEKDDRMAMVMIISNNNETVISVTQTQE